MLINQLSKARTLRNCLKLDRLPRLLYMAASVEIDEDNGAVTSGTVVAIIVTAGGTGYTNGASLTISGGGGSSAAGTIIVSGGVITGVNITNNGSGYTSPPTVTAPTGSGATFVAMVGTSGTKTHNPANSNMGSTDAAALDPVANPVSPGNNTYEKYQQIHLTNLNGSSKIQNFKVWRTSALGGSAVHKTNLNTSTAPNQSYAAPTASTSTQATQTMPTSAPGSQNIGVLGVYAGLTAAGWSDYIIHQIQTNAADTAGSTSTMNYQYDEIA